MGGQPVTGVTNESDLDSDLHRAGRHVDIENP